MKKKLFFIIIPFVLASTLFCAWQFHFFPFKNPYARIPVQFTSSQLPYVEAEIEGQKYLLVIDSGADGALSLKKEIVEKLDKKCTGKTFHYSITGEEKEALKYLIPKLQMGKVRLNNPTVDEGYTPGHSRIWGKKNSDIEISGTFGRKLLEITNLLLDFNNSVFFLVRSGESLKSLKKEGYFLENLVQSPFESDKNRIIFSVDTDVGEKRFLLDTGASVSFIRPSFATEEEHKEMRQHQMFMTTSKFVIANHDFGALDLYFYDIPDKLDDIDGILGMDFCKKHVIYLDFKGKKAFIGPSKKVHPGSK